MHRVKLPRWAMERGSGSNCFDSIDPARTALLIIDMQSAFVAEGEVFGNAHARDIVEPLNALAATMRDAGATIIWTRQTVSDEAPLAMPDWQYDLSVPIVARAVKTMRPGEAAHALYPAMPVEASDLVIDKYRYGAFMCPAGHLLPVLRERRVEMLVIAGTLTNVCVESTARDGNMLGYRVIVASDATAAVTDEEQAAALLNLYLHFADVKTVSEITEMLPQTCRA